MRQAVMVSPGKIEFRKVAEPGPLREGEVLLRIKKIGICGSDVHVYHGKHPATPYPVVQGHEYAALVEATGKGVTKVKEGMKVTARPQLVCGTCGPCRRGQYNACANLKVEGFQAPGVAQDLFIIGEDRLVVLDEHMSFAQGAMIEPAAVGAHASSRIDLNGKNVVVSGAGTIGNLLGQFAKVRGARKVLITDISAHRLEIAGRCHLEGRLNLKNCSFKEGIDDFFGEEGFQVGFEAAGVKASLDALMQHVEKGGEVVILGVFEENPVVNMYYLGEHELNVFGSMMYRHEDFLAARDMIAAGELVTDPLQTRSFPFEKYPEAYRFIEKEGERSMKVMIDM